MSAEGPPGESQPGEGSDASPNRSAILDAQRQRLATILTQAPAPVSVHAGPEHVFTFVNAAFEGLAGRPLLGRTMHEAFPECKGQPNLSMLHEAYEMGMPLEGKEVPLELTHPDGRRESLYLNLSYQPLRDAQGQVDAVVSFAMDVTAQVQARRHAEALAMALQESDARYRAFVAQSTEGIWRVEVDEPIVVALPEREQIELIFARGYFAECNDAMARMYGYDRAEALIGKRLRDLLVPDDPRNHEYLATFIRAGYRLEGGESHEVDKDGRPHVFENALVGIVENGRLLRAWGTQRDVTAQVESRHRAEAASRTKDEFFAMLGHELRNPLSPILTALELMRLRSPNAFSKERAIIERQVKHVVRLVDDLLDVSRITRGKISLERKVLDLADVVASAVELASPLLEQRAHRLSVEVAHGLFVDGDGMRLGQVFANLLTNAAKYTPSGGDITVTGERRGEWACVTVADSGIGIHPDILPRVFDLFVQERQSLDRSEGGLGLGLAIVRSLVSLHGGFVEAASPGLGQGSAFVVTLPSAPAEGRGVAPPLSLTRGRRGAHYRVLVVDDNEDAAAMLADGLGLSGHEVQVAHDGPSALSLAKSFRPELGLLDIGLPVMDGYELARLLRADPTLRDMRLVAVTGYGQAKDRSAAVTAGFDDHVVKPVDLARLELRLAALMDRFAEAPEDETSGG